MGKSTTVNTDQSVVTQSGNALGVDSVYSEKGGLAINARGGSGQTFNIQNLDKDFAAQVLSFSAAHDDKTTDLAKSLIDANNQLTVGSLTTLRDALSSTLDAPQLQGTAAASGSISSLLKANPLIFSVLAIGLLGLGYVALKRK